MRRGPFRRHRRLLRRRENLPPHPRRLPPPPAFPPGPPVELRIPLLEDFRYVHHPLSDKAGAIELLGNEQAVRDLSERIVHSDGGSFLITGFRGVGKTTVVEQALAELRELDDRELLDVKLNVARPKRIDQLLFEIIRRLFERLEERRVLERLDDDVRRELLLAYMRNVAFVQRNAHRRHPARPQVVAWSARGAGRAVLPRLRAVAR
jgi:AAA domain